MKVLMLNRHNAYSVFGGDTVQMEMTRRALVQLGVQVDVGFSDQLDAISSEYDIVHIFNLKTIVESTRCANFADQHGIPWVLSTIFYDDTESWYWRASIHTKRWKWLTGIMGYRITEALYRLWQSSKIVKTEQWRMQRSLLREAFALLPNSLSEMRALQRCFKLSFDHKRSFVIPNGIDIDFFCNRGKNANDQWLYLKEDGKPLILQVGRISPEKNNAALIEALWDLKVRIVFAGQFSPLTPDYTKLCLDLAERRGNVVFLGKVDHEALPGLYHVADVHVLPSWGESAGLVSLEAAVCGCKIVSTFIGGTRDYLGDEAWYCNPSNTDSIRQAVINALLGQRSVALKNRILENFTWSNAAIKTLEVYKIVLGFV